MAFSVATLEPRIRAILQSPGIDLATISAKRVRKRLMEDDPTLTAEIVKDYKDEIDKMIGSVYEEVSAATQEGQEGADEEGDEEEEPPQREVKSAPRPAKKAKKARKSETEITDEELARQLSSELNGRPGRSAKKATGGKSKRGTKRKSAEVVDSEGEGDEDGPRPKKRGGGFSKEYTLRSAPCSPQRNRANVKRRCISEPLAALLQAEKMSRPQVVKNLWVHIRGQNLQNPADKREIICDESMKAVFGVDKMNMFAMNKMLGQ